LEAKTERPTGKILIAFAIIYFVWGSTFYAIRIGVHEVPPLLLAAMRFFTAGAVMYGWLMTRRERSPTARQWMAASLLGFLIFVCDYGLLFWAEQRVPSGIAAVVLATIPVFIALCEIVLLRTQRLTVILAAFSWSISTVLTKRLPLPESKPMSSAAQMLSGGIMLILAAAIAGDFRGFHPAAISPGAWFALAYLIVFGSIIGFTAYIWLLHHESPTKVGTYAYVNPVVAVLVGYFLGGEALGPRTVLGTLCVLVSVVLITRAGAKKPADRLQVGK
jgi:drug/metabolite transporter (DMT)-like permease